MQKSSAFILGVSFIIAVVSGIALDKGYTTYDDYSVISTQGSAEAWLEAQSVFWTAVVYRKGKTVAGTYRAVEKDSNAIKAFFLGNGLSENDFTFSAILTDSNSFEQNAITASRKVTISTDKIDAVEKIFKSLSELAKNDISLTAAYNSTGAGAPVYAFDSKKMAVQNELFVKAFENAKEQAQLLAKKNGMRIIGVNNVYRVLEDYGYYDDSYQNMGKTQIFTVVVNADFRIKE